jgi:hypothetical protein
VNPFAALYAFWLGIPTPMREPFKKAVVSLVMTALTVYGTLQALSTDPTANPLHLSLWVFVKAGFIGSFIVAVLNGGVRAAQGYQAAVDPQSAVPKPVPPATVAVVENLHT